MNNAHQQAISFGGVGNFRRVSLLSQMSSGSNSQQQVSGLNNSIHQSLSVQVNLDQRQRELSNQISKQNLNNFQEGVVSDNESSVGFPQNKQLVANLRHSNFQMEESILTSLSSANALSSPSPIMNIERQLQSSFCIVGNNYKERKITPSKIRMDGETDISSEHMSTILLEGEHLTRQIAELTKKDMTSLPEQILLRKNQITDIDLSYNLFEVFPMELCDFVQLRRLRMDNNRLREIPEQIAFLKQLELLSFSHNFLVQLPATLQSISKLKTLNVNHNSLTNINSEITNLYRLESLAINNNLFTHLTYKLFNLKKLKQLSLDWFKYLKPATDLTINKSTHALIFNKLFELCNRKSSSYMNNDISFREFIRHLSLYEHDLLQKDIRQRTIAFTAVENEELGVMKSLFHEKVDINQLDLESYTLLIISLLQNKQRSIQFLLDCGADPKIGGGMLGSTLHLSVSRLNLEVTKKLLDLGVNPNGTDLDGNTPLHVAFCSFSKNNETAKEICNELLNHGADPNALSKELWAPLHLAVRRNQKEAIRFAHTYNQKEKEDLKFEELDLEQLDLDEYQPSRKSDDLNGSYLDKSPNNRGSKITSEVSKSNDVSQDQQYKIQLDYHKREEDLSEDLEFKSPQLTPEQSNSHLNMKISKKSSKRLFNFDIEGGYNIWTPMHLAANIGNINILELLSEFNACPFAMTKFAQTPRKVALQSLILFKIMRKHETKWMINTIQKKDEGYLPSDRNNLMHMERSIQDLRGYIAETMKSKQHFLSSQLDLFDDKEFGYTIKENMKNNQGLLPRNGQQGAYVDEEDEILDPEMSVERQQNPLKFGPSAETLSINNSSLLRSGTLKPQQFGYGIPKVNKVDGNIFQINESPQEKQEEEKCFSEMEEDLFEETSEYNGCMNNVVKFSATNQSIQLPFEKNSGQDLPQSQIAFAAFQNLPSSPSGNTQNFPDSRFLSVPSNIQGINKLNSSQEQIDNKKSSDCFTDLKCIDISEIEKLGEIATSEESIFCESLHSLMLLRFLHIRLSNKDMVFANDKETLPRNIHILNEFLLPRLCQKDIQDWKESILNSISLKIFEALFARFQSLPAPESQLNYQCLTKATQTQSMNNQICQLLLFAKDSLLNLNYYTFFQSFLKQCLLKLENNNILAFSSGDYSSTILLAYENMHTFKTLQHIYNNTNQTLGYLVIGSPSFFISHQYSFLNNSFLKQKQRTNSVDHHSRSKNQHSQISQIPFLPLNQQSSTLPLNSINTKRINNFSSAVNGQIIRQSSESPKNKKQQNPIQKVTTKLPTNKYFKEEIPNHNKLDHQKGIYYSARTGEENIEEEDLSLLHSTLEANPSCVEKMQLKQLSSYAQKI